MQLDGRRIRPIGKQPLSKRLRDDPLRAAELLLLAAGMFVSALSSFFAWQAASSSAEQAKFAHEALTTADANSTFRTYMTSWNRMCNAIMPPQYFLTVGTPVLVDDGELLVTATNLGFDGAAFDINRYVDRVAGAEDAAKDDFVQLKTFLPDEIGPLEQALSTIDYFYNSDLIKRDGRDTLKTKLIRAAALCHYYMDEQIRWFKDRSHLIKPIIFFLPNMTIRYSSDFPAAPMGR